MDKISIIIPCLNEQEAIPVYYRAMVKVMDQMRGIAFELLFVDDGSNDGTLEILRNISTMDRRCRYLSFSRILERKRRFMQVSAMYRAI